MTISPLSFFLQVWSIDGKKYKYSLVACVTTCLQEEVKSTCDCIMGFFAPSYTFTNLSITPYCLDMKEPFETISNRSKCMTEIARASVPKCADCHPPCKEFRYHKSSFSANWPRNNQLMPFYHNYIKGSSNAQKFSIFEDIDKLFREGNVTEGNRMLQDTSLIKDNFAKVSVYLSSVDVVVVEDHVGVAIFDLLAKIGGTLNLYSGISCIVMVEIIDFLYNIIWQYGKNKPTNSSAVTVQT